MAFYSCLPPREFVSGFILGSIYLAGDFFRKTALPFVSAECMCECVYVCADIGGGIRFPEPQPQAVGVLITKLSARTVLVLGSRLSCPPLD